MRNIVEELRNECQSSTEQLIFNDKMFDFINKNRRLKKYENDKKEMMMEYAQLYNDKIE